MIPLLTRKSNGPAPEDEVDKRKRKSRTDQRRNLRTRQTDEFNNSEKALAKKNWVSPTISLSTKSLFFSLCFSISLFLTLISI